MRSAHHSSFRDPSGYLYWGADGTLYRRVNRCYEAEYRYLMGGGLYKRLTNQGLLIEHEEVPAGGSQDEQLCCILRPRCIQFQSYPYEWAFSALKNAALLTLQIQQISLRAGMSLKDASAYNVMFEGYKPIFIDTLSFERLVDGAPWQGYAQFCRHFLAPLALMSRSDISLGRLLALHIDGIPLDLASRLLPLRSWLRPGLLIHLHIHAQMVRRYSDTSQQHTAPSVQRRVSKSGLLALVESLERTIKGQTWCVGGTEWADYYSTSSYDASEFQKKLAIVERFLCALQPKIVWDLGANTGVFSRMATKLGAMTYAFDLDPGCVELNYLQCSKEQNRKLLPLLVDLSNPSPSIGWANAERVSLVQRGPVDVVLALALIHHLAISNNTPFERVAEFLHSIARSAIVEFVPKSDPQAQRLLRSRRDVFCDYDEHNFERVFAGRFSICETVPITGTGRKIYLLRAR